MSKHLKSVENTDNNAALIRGKIITAAIGVEHQMDFLLANYFNSEKEIEIYEQILLPMNWENKIGLIEKIAKIKAIDCKIILKRIRKVKEIRNSMAHWKQLYKVEDEKLDESKIDFFKFGKSMITFSPKEISEQLTSRDFTMIPFFANR